jgi:DNA polymerase-3 subunit epsilon
MRQIILDTETTGLDPKQGHRIIELAGLEVVNRRATGRTIQFFIDPEREIDTGATEVHGKTWEDLKGRPKFRDVADEFIEFARGAEWIIHNAPFDVTFLDLELGLAGHPGCGGIYAELIDTLALAREMFPGKRNNLDALCERFGIDNSHRALHGALLDAQLLAEVWLAMTRGQETLTIDMGAPSPRAAGELVDATWSGNTAPRRAVKVQQPSPEEIAAHLDYLAALDKESKGRCVWLALDAAAPPPAPPIAAAVAGKGPVW